MCFCSTILSSVRELSNEMHSYSVGFFCIILIVRYLFVRVTSGTLVGNRDIIYKSSHVGKVKFNRRYSMKLSAKCVKTFVMAAAITMFAIPAMAGNGPGDGTGNGGNGPGDGTGNGPGTGDCTNAITFNMDADLLVRGGNGNGGNGPGDGTGNGGNGPGDGTGNGPGTGDCLNV